MKKKVFLMIVVVLLLSGAAAFSQNTICVDNSSQAVSDAKSSAVSVVKVGENSFLVSLGNQSLPQILTQDTGSPKEQFHYQKLSRPFSERDGEEITLQQTEAVLKRVTPALSLKPPFFRTEPFIVKSTKEGYPVSQEATIRYNLFSDSNELKDYIRMNDIRVSSNRPAGVDSVDADECFNRAANEAMKNGADLLVIREVNQGLNNVVIAKSSGYPLGVSVIRGDTMYTGGAGYVRSEVSNSVNPGVIIIPYILKKRANVNAMGKAGAIGINGDNIRSVIVVYEDGTTRAVPIPKK